MPIIDGDGLATGKRLRKCSDRARLFWPYLFCYSNGYGRFEADYEVIRARVFLGFQHLPTDEELMGVLQEYCDAGLLFMYTHNREVWGQWDTKDKYLKRHKTSSDHESPRPPEPQFSTWKRSITESKELPKSSETLFAFVRGVGVGVGVGVGNGEGNKTSSRSDDRGDVVESSPKPEKQPVLIELLSKTERVSALFEKFWQHAWLKVGKQDARRAFPKALKFVCESRRCSPEEATEYLIDLAKREGQYALVPGNEYRASMHPATWLNGQRWNDEIRNREPPTTGKPKPPEPDFDPSRIWSTLGKPVKQPEQPK